MLVKKELPIMVKNKTYTYITPILGKEALNIKYLLRNTFIGDEDYPNYDNHIFLLYKFSGDMTFYRLEKELQYSKYFVESYNPDSFTTMKVFEVPSEYQKEYNMFIKSKYSRFSEKYKKEILEFHSDDMSKVLSDILYKKEDAYKKLEEELDCYIPRELEASGKWNVDKEVYNSSMKIDDADYRTTIK